MKRWLRSKNRLTFLFHFSLHAEQQNEEGETKEFLKTIGEIERLQPDIYYVEPLTALNGSEGGGGGTAPVDTKITQKQGYLFMKT